MADRILKVKVNFIILDRLAKFSLASQGIKHYEMILKKNSEIFRLMPEWNLEEVSILSHFYS